MLEPRMQTTMECEQFVVFDDVLAADELEKLWQYFQAQPFMPINAGAPGSPWLPTDGRPMTGPGVHVWADPAAAIPDAKNAKFPTGAPIDLVLQRLVDNQARLAPWVGPSVEEWAVLTAATWLYSAGSALSWHTDGAMYSGAFSFYLHAAWDPHWGGELVLAHPGARNQRELVKGDYSERFDRSRLASTIADVGIGTAIVPRPNRLVVIAGGHPHKIARVDAAAGNHVRASISGFYVRARSLAKVNQP